MISNQPKHRWGTRKKKHVPSTDRSLHPVLEHSQSIRITKKKWTKVNTYLTSFRDHLRAVIAVTCQIGISSPIGSDEGIWGILMGGKFMTPNPSQSLLQDQTRETAKLSALAQVLKAMVSLIVASIML